MAKNLKINVKNAQLAEALKIGQLKKPSLKKKVAEEPSQEESQATVAVEIEKSPAKATKKKVAPLSKEEGISKPKGGRKKKESQEESQELAKVQEKKVIEPPVPVEREVPSLPIAEETKKETPPPPAKEEIPLSPQKSEPPFRSSSYPQRPQSQPPYRSSSSGGYSERPSQDRYPQRPAQGNYEQRPSQGSYGPRSDYPQRSSQGGYPPRSDYPQRSSQGGYPPRSDYPQRTSEGGYPQRSSYGGGGYGAQRPQTGGYPSSRPPYGTSPSSQQRPPYGSRPPAHGGGYPPRSGPGGAPSSYRPYPQQPYRPGSPAPYRPRPPGQEGGARPPYPYRPRPPFGGQPGGAGGFRPGIRPPLGQARPPEDGKEERRNTRNFDTKPQNKEFREHKPSNKRVSEERSFDARDRQGLRDGDEEGWRRRRPSHHKMRQVEQEEVIRPKSLRVRIPITIKDLASEMKLKSSQLISKLFMKGVVVTINDFLDDETTIQLLGHDFDCEIGIDRAEEVRLRITDKTIKQEIAETEPADLLVLRPPVIAFMGHVDHGKTSLIDAIRTSNIASAEAGAITQHIGAFKCHTAAGDIAILDTPGHEAFSAMRSRGSDITDIIVLVIAGDEGMRTQTIEAMQQAKAASVPIVVAINKCDKPNFNAENVYRQLADHELLPEVWGGQTITINCSAVTKEGINTLLEMLALQAEVLELKANPQCRARGTVIESEMHKGLGAVATVLVQNGTLKLGDALVFSHEFAKVKTMHDEHDKELVEAGPSTPVKITGLSGLPPAGSEFIVVKSEKEAMEIAEKRSEGHRHRLLHQAKRGLDSVLADKAAAKKKVLNLIVRADVQGSVEAIKTSLLKIASEKAEINIISAAVGEVSESDVQLASASKSVIIGFHTQVESHAESLIKSLKIDVRLHDIIYHAVDDVKELMLGLLDKIAQETTIGSAEVKALFKASRLGLIAGCMVTDGMIKRSSHVKQIRDKKEIWKGPIHSLKKVKEDVREVSKGHECGIVLGGQTDIQVGDTFEAFEVSYLAQEL